MEIKYNTDVIVVGAGPAGISAALEVARGGKRVVLLERSKYPGSKNMYGGAIYTTALKEIFPQNFSEIPYERIINSHSYCFLSEGSSFEMTYTNKESKNAYAIKRFNLDKWMIEQAKKEGVVFCPETLVKSLITRDNKTIGIQTELEEYYAPIVIIADGVNSILARQIGLRKDYESKDMILSAKEVIKFNKKTIEQKFNLFEDLSTGANKLFIGSDFGKLKGIKNLFMMGFLYTFKDSIALGVGANLEDLSKNKLNINDILNELKNHPDIKPFVEGGQIIEYSAHLIPEGGYKKLPRLADDGVLVAGDAAGLVNGVHFEGTNFALISGKLAGKTALDALKKEDWSKNRLNNYQKELKKSFILKDLYSYRNIIENLHKRSNSIEIYYPNRIKEFFEIIFSANCISKAKQFRKFMFNFINKRNICELFKDFFTFLKCAIDVICGR